jgi:hypothetical protein
MVKTDLNEYESKFEEMVSHLAVSRSQTLQRINTLYGNLTIRIDQNFNEIDGLKTGADYFKTLISEVKEEIQNLKDRPVVSKSDINLKVDPLISKLNALESYLKETEEKVEFELSSKLESINNEITRNEKTDRSRHQTVLDSLDTFSASIGRLKINSIHYICLVFK